MRRPLSAARRQGLLVEVAAFERVAEHAERVDDDVRISDRVFQFVRQRGQILFHRLPKEGLDAFKPELDEFTHRLTGIWRPGSHHRADADVLKDSHFNS